MIDFKLKRFMAIARFPLSCDPIGSIREEGEYTNFDMAAFPNLFRLMEWWEYRAPEEMPAYVEKITENDGYHLKGDLFAVSWTYNNPLLTATKDGKSKWVAEIDSHCYNASVLLPRTKDEYDKAPKENKPS